MSREQFVGYNTNDLALELGVRAARLRDLGHKCKGDLEKVKRIIELTKDDGPGKKSRDVREEIALILIEEPIKPGFYAFDMPEIPKHKPMYETPADSWRDDYTWIDNLERK